ncbi:MAG: ECF transporter S component [Oscillospiraceae bacterium]|nr:ECF transporter S component [Oscillospiraceae bacterium]
MNKKIRWITETAILLALLVTLQAVTKPLGQLVTGSCVNAILAVAVLFAGLGSGLTIAVISPVLAFLLGIAPQILTVPAIMVGNAVFVLLLHFLADPAGKKLVKQLLAWLVAAAAKFAVLYLIVTKVICGFLADSLMEAGTLKAPMLKALPATFSWPQLFTALLGGAVALLITPVLRKALKK